MILIYAFSNQWGTNISRRTLLDLQKLLPSDNFAFRLIFFHPRAFFQKYIRNDQYDLIIGLGDGSDRCTKARIETVATNRYGPDPIYEFASFKLELSLPPLDLVNPDSFDISEFMGTYNCNWIVYTIQNHLNQHHIPTPQLFFHLPKRINSRTLAFQIQELLVNNSLL